MATYDAATNKWIEDQNENVGQRVAGLMSRQSPLMQQARTSGAQQSARRGLMNATQGIQAAEAEAYRVALPIASQEASQASQANLQRRDISSQQFLQGREHEYQAGAQQRDLASRQAMLEMELGSRERVAEADRAAQKERLGAELTSREKIALQELKAAEARLQQQLQSEHMRQQRDIISREQQAERDREMREQEQLQREREGAVGASVSFETQYANLVNSIMNNTELSAEARQQALDHAAAMRDNNMNLVEQAYGFSYEWGSGSGGSGSGSGGGGTGSGSSAMPETTVPIPEDQMDNMNIFLAARDAGMTPEQVAQNYNLPIEDVYEWLEYFGLSL